MSDFWSNKLENGGSVGFASRFIASWVRVGGELTIRSGNSLFKKWIDSFEWLTDDDKAHIKFLANNGKLELETNAKEFINKNSIVKV